MLLRVSWLDRYRPVAGGWVGGLGADEVHELVFEDVVAAAAGQAVGRDDTFAGVALSGVEVDAEDLGDVAEGSRSGRGLGLRWHKHRAPGLTRLQQGTVCAQHASSRHP